MVIGPFRTSSKVAPGEEGTQRPDTVRADKHRLAVTMDRDWISLGWQEGPFWQVRGTRYCKSHRREMCEQVMCRGQWGGRSWRADSRSEGLGCVIKMPLFSGDRVWYCKSGVLSRKFCLDSLWRCRLLS